MNLILCDDDKVFLNKLEIRIRGLCQKHKIAVKMECYVSAKEMLEGIKNLDEISVFFIDIDMPEVNGFEVASYLKKWNRECCIVFVSNKDDLVFQSLVYHPFFFIRKAHLDEELEPQLLELQKKAGKKVPQIELQTAEKKLEAHKFVRTHKGYLVNMNYVYRLREKELLLLNGKSIPVSRNYLNQVRMKIMGVVME